MTIAAPKAATKTCAISGCTHPAGRLNICTGHTHRHRRFLAFGFTIAQTRALVLADYGFTTIPPRVAT